MNQIDGLADGVLVAFRSLGAINANGLATYALGSHWRWWLPFTDGIHWRWWLPFTDGIHWRW